MKTFQKILVFSFFLLSSFGALSQARPDIGERFNSAEYNRIQLEFRKPMTEKYIMRFGLSQGQWSGFHYSNVFSVNDSIVTFREKSGRGNYYDFRFGFERNLSWKNLSLHADIIVAYNKMDYHNWDSYSVKDSLDVWNHIENNSYPVEPLPNNTTSTEHLFGGGLAAGISYNIPLSTRFILNLNLNYTGLIRFNDSYQESDDWLNEFNETNATTFDFYTSAGVGLRYVFLKREKSEKSEN